MANILIRRSPATEYDKQRALKKFFSLRERGYKPSIAANSCGLDKSTILRWVREASK